MKSEPKMGQEVTTESRRKFLKTAGKFAVYTPPALMLMSNASATYVKDTTGQVKKRYKHKDGRKYGRKNGDQSKKYDRSGGGRKRTTIRQILRRFFS